MMNPIGRRLSLTCSAIAIVGAGIAYAETDAGDAGRGKQLYYQHACYSCHGYNGETGIRDLVGTDSPIIANAQAFIAFLRLRGDMLPAFPSTTMPSYPQAALADADALDIYAYIRTFELDAPEVNEEPALRAVLDSVTEN